MFRSKIRPTIVPQYEHGRMAGILANHWGNDEFDRPVLDFEQWVAGVAFHDWHYGMLDNLSIGEASEEVWLAMVEQGVQLRLDNPIADIVAKVHLRRLLGDDASLHAALVRRIDLHINGRLAESGHALADFQWADRITNLCDMVAFDFGFGMADPESFSLFARQGNAAESTLQYQIQPDGQITVGPWPFAVPQVTGTITGFAAAGYPEHLQPQWLRFTVSPLAVQKLATDEL